MQTSTPERIKADVDLLAGLTKALRYDHRHWVFSSIDGHPWVVYKSRRPAAKKFPWPLQSSRPPNHIYEKYDTSSKPIR
jgi:hypothetical protein